MKTLRIVLAGLAFGLASCATKDPAFDTAFAGFMSAQGDAVRAMNTPEAQRAAAEERTKLKSINTAQ